MSALKFIALGALTVVLSIQEDPNLAIRICSFVSLTLMLFEALDLTPSPDSKPTHLHLHLHQAR